MSKTEVS